MSEPPVMDLHEHHQGQSAQHGLTMLALGGAAVAAGVIVAPYVLSATGFGEERVLKETFATLHTEEVGSGLAKIINEYFVEKIPLIGGSIAKGGVVNAATAGVLSIGGVLAGNFISERQKDKKTIDWGRAIKWIGLATSALVALPSVLSGLSTGLIYLAGQLSLPQSVTDFAANKIGTIPYNTSQLSGLSGAAAVVPHLVTCGLSLIPATAGLGLNGYIASQRAKEKDMSEISSPAEEKKLLNAAGFVERLRMERASQTGIAFTGP